MLACVAGGILGRFLRKELVEDAPGSPVSSSGDDWDDDDIVDRNRFGAMRLFRSYDDARMLEYIIVICLGVGTSICSSYLYKGLCWNRN